LNFKTDSEALMLAALKDHPLHGYAIVKKIRESSDGLFKLSEGQLYPLLYRMQAKGWLSAEWVTDGAGPAKKCYSLLEQGEKELETRTADWNKFARAVSGILSLKEGVRHA
jgi:PadR family transcriptional regulator, regulatory protein PadR